MRRVIFLFTLLLVLAGNANAQLICSISGNVVDQNHMALPYASVVLENVANKQTLGTVTDDKGYFCFNKLSPGSYKLAVNYLGYVGHVSGDMHIGHDEKYELPNIVLQPEVTDISEVVVTGITKVSELKPSYIKYKSAGLVSQAGGNAGDILKNMPSVAMGGSPGHNRDIRYRGLGNAYTKVLINGRETGFKGNNRESVLDQIPASSIDYIEILSVPGADYQSEGLNGIVNIVLKENQDYGTQGSIELLTGNYDGLSGGVHLSHKTEKLNLYGQYDFQQRALPKEKDKLKTSFKDGAITGFESNLEHEDKKFNNRLFRTGMSYFVLPKSKVNFEYVYGYQLEDKDKINDIYKLAADGSFKSATQELKTEYKPNDYHQATASFSHTFEGNQRFDAGLGYLTSTQDKLEGKTVYNVTEDGRWADFQPKLENKRELKEGDEFDWYANLANLKFLSQNFKIGYQGKSEKMKMVVVTDKFNYKDNSWTSTAGANDNFEIGETTHSFYVTDDYHFSLFRLNTGLRYELTHLDNRVVEGTQKGSGDYKLLLPNLSLTANLDKTQHITFNFGRRIRRPGVKNLNPYEEEKEAGYFKKGNPDLMPERAWAYELGYLKNFKKINLGTNLFYRDIHDVIQTTLSEDADGVITEMPENTGRAWTAGVEFMLGIKAFDFWQLNASYSLFDSKITSGAYNGDALTDQYKWSAKAINDFKLPYRINAQMAFNAVGPKVSGIKEENTIWFADFGVEKDFARRGSIIFRVTDVFDSLAKEKTEFTDASTTKEDETTVGRIISIGVRYKF